MGGRMTPADPEMGSTMTAAMVEASWQGDQALQLVGEMGTPRRQPAREGIVSDVQGMRQMIHAGQHGGGEVLAVVHDAADGGAAETHAVVALFAADEAHPLAGRRGRGDRRRRFSAPYPPTPSLNW